MKPLSATRKSKPSLSISTTCGSASARRRTSSASAIDGPPRSCHPHALKAKCRHRQPDWGRSITFSAMRESRIGRLGGAWAARHRAGGGVPLPGELDSAHEGPGTEAEQEKVEEHLRGDDEAGGLGLGGDVAKPDGRED